MSGGYALEFSDLLIAMKQALLAQTALPYLNDCRIYNGPWYLGPWSNYSVYLRPMGSPEVVMAEDGGAGVTKHAIHEVAIEACMSISNPSDEDSVIGRTGARIGITTFVSTCASSWRTTRWDLRTTSSNTARHQPASSPVTHTELSKPIRTFGYRSRAESTAPKPALSTGPEHIPRRKKK